MSGYYYGVGVCVCCRNIFAFNPERVPSIRPFGEGEKQPLCKGCALRWCAIHKANPKDVIKDGAYEPEPMHPYEALGD